jgi:rRNA maturation endonuclease Nob1
MIEFSALVLTAAALGFVLFVRQRDIPEPVPVSPIQHLEDRKQAIYDNLRDLQFEYRLGKLSDEDYRETKLALQKELAVVLSEMEATAQKLGLTTKRVAPKPVNAPVPGTKCLSCGAVFPQPLKFCGECGKAIA